MNTKKRVYLTALTNDRYIPGVMALVRSLIEVGSKYNIAIMIPEEKEGNLGNKIRDYGVLNYPGVFLLPKKNIEIPDADRMEQIIEEKYSYWKDSFFKLQAARCTEFSKIVLLDCDQMAVKNIDHLFDKPHLTATVCGKCVHPNWGGLSAGVVVLEPSEDLHDKLLSNLATAIEFKYEKGQQAGDQDVFHITFPEWRSDKSLYIPEIYNICWAWVDILCKTENCSPKEFYMIHFPGKVKPWNNGKWHYLKLFAVLLAKGKTDRIFYKVKIWRKYRRLCEYSAKRSYNWGIKDLKRR